MEHILTVALLESHFVYRLIVLIDDIYFFHNLTMKIEINLSALKGGVSVE
jgi:hypothetical protein